jgi:hypothetical protein
MNYTLILFTLLFTSLGFGQYDFSLEDINDTSPFFGGNVGPFTFPQQVSVVYFGHYN